MHAGTKMHTLKVRGDHLSGSIELDGKRIEGVTGLILQFAGGGPARATIEMQVDTDIEAAFDEVVVQKPLPQPPDGA